MLLPVCTGCVDYIAETIFSSAEDKACTPHYMNGRALRKLDVHPVSFMHGAYA